MIYVAVVCKLWEKSGRRNGDWASFIDKNKKAAIARAREARKEWTRKGYGPYRILVGTLNEEVKVPVAYKLVELREPLPSAPPPPPRAWGNDRDPYWADRDEF